MKTILPDNENFEEFFSKNRCRCISDITEAREIKNREEEKESLKRVLDHAKSLDW